jgi:oligopeptide transport system permease protein
MPDNYENYVRYSDQFPLGADDLGRDLWTRTIYGARISLSIAVVASTVSLVIGTIYGLISGYIGGAVDNVMMRVVDFLYGFPFIVVVILLQTYFKALAKRGAEGSIGQVMVNLNNSFRIHKSRQCTTKHFTCITINRNCEIRNSTYFMNNTFYSR